MRKIEWNIGANTYVFQKSCKNIYGAFGRAKSK